MKKIALISLCVAATAMAIVYASDAAAADAAAGKAKYQQFCSACHGAGGKGDGPGAASLNPKPRDHTDGKYMKTLSDEQLFKVIKLGGMGVGKAPTMPPWGGAMTDADIRNVIAYIRTLAK